MRFDPRSWLLRNWPIKLAALFLAALLWVLVAEPERRVPVDVRITLPPGRTHEPLPTVTALVVGRAHQLFGLYGNRLRIAKAIPDTVTASEVTVRLYPQDVVVPPELTLTVQDVDPHELVVVVIDEGAPGNREPELAR